MEVQGLEKVLWSIILQERKIILIFTEKSLSI